MPKYAIGAVSRYDLASMALMRALKSSGTSLTSTVGPPFIALGLATFCFDSVRVLPQSWRFSDLCLCLASDLLAFGSSKPLL